MKKTIQKLELNDYKYYVETYTEMIDVKLYTN